MKFSDHLKYSQLLCTVPLEHLSHTKNEELGALHKLPKIGRHDCSKEGTDWLLRLPRRERPGCSREGTGW